MRLRLPLLLAALDLWRDGVHRRHPGWRDHCTRWSLLSWLAIQLYLLVLLPLTVLLGVVRLAPHDAGVDVIHLHGALKPMLIATMALTIATALRMSGFARTVMGEFRDQRRTVLILATAAGGFVLYLGHVAMMATSRLDVTRGDNGMLAAFMVAWVWAVTRVCQAPIDRARDSWDLGLARVLRR